MKKFIKAANAPNDITLEFMTPNLEVAQLVSDKAWEIGGFGSTYDDSAWSYIDVPASQDASKIGELIDFAQDNGAFLNKSSARGLKSFGFELGDIDAACGKKSVRATSKPAPKRAIKAEIDYEGLDEDEIMEAEYATIEAAIDGVDKLSAWVDAIKAGIEEYKQDWSPWDGPTSEWEMFGGPDDAEAFTDSIYDITSELEKISRTLGDVLNVYIYPEGV